MIPLKNDDLLAFLKDEGYDSEIQEATNQVFFRIQVVGQEFPAFARVYEGGALLQLIVFLPCQISPTAIPDLSRLLHALNKELDIPGFGLDESSNTIFFRCMLPKHDQGMPKLTLQGYLGTMHTICESFSGAIASVAAGKLTFDEMLEKVQEMEQKPQK